MPVKKDGLFKVECKACGATVGFDKKTKKIETCTFCKKINKKEKKKSKHITTFSENMARVKKGPAADLPAPHNETVFRSGWERNFARVLVFNKRIWTYERTVFTFHGVQRKPRTYIPDFYVETTDTIWEIKGYLTATDRLKIRRLRKQYPGEFLKFNACCSRNNKAAIEFFQSLEIPMTFIEDLRDEYASKIPEWE